MHFAFYHDVNKALRVLASSVSLWFILLIPGNGAVAAQGEPEVVEVNLGSYQIMPHEIRVVKDRRVILLSLIHI